MRAYAILVPSGDQVGLCSIKTTHRSYSYRFCITGKRHNIYGEHAATGVRTESYLCAVWRNLGELAQLTVPRPYW